MNDNGFNLKLGSAAVSFLTGKPRSKNYIGDIKQLLPMAENSFSHPGGVWELTAPVSGQVSHSSVCFLFIYYFIVAQHFEKFQLSIS